MAKLPQHVREMTQWPHTPTPQLLQDALRLIFEAERKFSDLVISDSHDQKFQRRMEKAVADHTAAQLATSENKWQQLATKKCYPKFRRSATR